jgi:hypothetical protein
MPTVRRADIKRRRLVRTKRKGGPAPKRGLRTTLQRGEGDYFFGAEAGCALTVDRSVLTRHGLIKGCFLHTAGGGAARTDVAMEKINPEMTVRLFLSSFMTFFLCQPARYGLAMLRRWQRACHSTDVRCRGGSMTCEFGKPESQKLGTCAVRFLRACIVAPAGESTDSRSARPSIGHRRLIAATSRLRRNQRLDDSEGRRT